MDLQDHVKDVKLKDCPFCTHTPSIWIEDDSQRSLILHISCGWCPCEFVTHLAIGSKEPLDKNKLQSAIDRWNTRPLIDY